MVYKVGKKVKQDKKVVRRYLAGIAASLAIVTGAAVPALAVGGRDANGYNATARNFVGTGSSWCQYKGLPSSCQDTYGNDKLVMKWNAAWDACNAAGNNEVSACLGAWVDNEWNGNVPGGSGTSEHYKIIWVGSAADSSPYWKDGGYSVWGNYEVVMDQGTGSTGHVWYAHAAPNGYGGPRP